ncbi:MAG: hypothetical protein CME36_09505 [unclassified Hahellaceae]|nr:hypothetical protein [Hahellaceae bacterium]
MDESVLGINRRQDDSVHAEVLSALQDGATLRIHPKIRRAAVEGLDEKDLRNGRTVTLAYIHRLQKQGLLMEVAMYKYRLTDRDGLEGLEQ